jgi:type IV secretory pathway component VirB8
LACQLLINEFIFYGNFNKFTSNYEKEKKKKITISKNSNVDNATLRIVKKETENNNLENSKRLKSGVNGSYSENSLQLP